MTCPDCQRLQMENRRLAKENAELRRRLAAHGIRDEEALDLLTAVASGLAN